MRKFLWVVAVGALVLALAAPAMALDFKFGGQYQLRFWSYEGVGFGSVDGTAGAHPRDVQIRFMPRFETSDDNGNIQTMIRLRMGWNGFGDGGGAGGAPTNAGWTYRQIDRTGPSAGGAVGNRGVNIETSWMYLDFAAPWGIPLRVRGGYQPLYWHKAILIDDSIAGIRLYGATKPFTYEAGWYRATGGPNTAAAPAAGGAARAVTSNTYDNNYDFYQFQVGAEVVPWFNPTVDFVYGDNRLNCTPVACPSPANRVRTVFYGGLAVKGKAGIVSYDLDWVYGFADGGMAGTFGSVGGLGQHTVKGWALDAGLHFPIGPVTINPVASYATGDASNGGDSEAFPGGISPAWNGPGGYYELIGNGGTLDAATVTQSVITNMWVLGLVFEYRPVKAMYTKFAWGYAGFAKKAGNCAAATQACYGPSYAGRPDKPLGAKTTLGNELSFRMDYDLYTGFKARTFAGWFIPSRGDTAQEYGLQLLYEF